MSWDSESPNRLWIGRRNAPNSLLERDPALLSPSARDVSHYPGGHAEGFPDTFKALYLAVYGWIAVGRGPAAGIPDIRRRGPRGPALRGDRAECNNRVNGWTVTP